MLAHAAQILMLALPVSACLIPLSPRPELAGFTESVMMHSAVPRAVEDVIHAMPHDAHPMAIILTGLCALSGCHPEQNPALAGQNVYKSREVQDQQIARLIGKVSSCWAGCCWAAVLRCMLAWLLPSTLPCPASNGLIVQCCGDMLPCCMPLCSVTCSCAWSP